jgi:hypothetical protein
MLAPITPVPIQPILVFPGAISIPDIPIYPFANKQVVLRQLNCTAPVNRAAIFCDYAQ